MALIEGVSMAWKPLTISGSLSLTQWILDGEVPGSIPVTTSRHWCGTYSTGYSLATETYIIGVVVQDYLILLEVI